jgi:hypothetical protein
MPSTPVRATRACALALTLGVSTHAGHAEAPRCGHDAVGLSLFFQDGVAAPLRLSGDGPRYLQELDIVASATTSDDQGITPLKKSGDLAQLDWRGVQFIEEDWRPAADGTFTRQRFYRGARWMDQESTFTLIASAGSRPLGPPLVVSAGADARTGAHGDFFVRRFVARQTTTGCAAIGDCSGAQAFTAQGLVQLREAENGAERARALPAGTTKLTLAWSADPHHPRSVDVATETSTSYAFGFDIDVEPVAPPENGQFYLPGDTVSFRMAFRDGSGALLHLPGALPSYAEFLGGTVASGLRYVDLFLNPTLYYALKKRESNLLISLSGPTDRLKVPRATVAPGSFFLPQVPIATTALDGWTGLAQGVPPFAVSFGGLQNPLIWATPTSDVASFTIPADALPGTYVVAVKARRDFAGEALNRTTTASIQVGTATPTSFNPTTGHCSNCHQGAAALGSILHGAGDRRACYSCHAPIFFEPDNSLDYRVHFVHSRSRRFPGNVNDCSLCHTSPPTGPARGFPGTSP